MLESGGNQWFTGDSSNQDAESMAQANAMFNSILQNNGIAEQFQNAQENVEEDRSLENDDSKRRKI